MTRPIAVSAIRVVRELGARRSHPPAGGVSEPRRMMRPILVSAIALATLAAPIGASAQEQPIEEFVEQVAWLWGMGDVAAIVDLMSTAERVTLDTGSGSESVTARHAAAALRALFDNRDTEQADAVRATVAGGDPPRGFGQIEWTFRRRGAPGARTVAVFVGAVREGDAWRVRELRVMP